MQDKLSMFSSVTSTIAASNRNHSILKIKLTAADHVYKFLFGKFGNIVVNQIYLILCVSKQISSLKKSGF